MKLITKILMSAAIGGTILPLMSSCNDFLEVNPATAITEETMFSNVEFAESNIQSCYKKWRALFCDRWLWEPMVGTDEIQSGAYQALKEGAGQRGSLDHYNALLTADLSPYIDDQWSSRWPAVSEAAKLINALEPQLTEDGKSKADELYGEASFIRGGLTMELAFIFGEVPILDVARTEELGYGRQPIADVWQFIINDFRNAAKYCPKKNNPGRATKDAAKMLLAYSLMSAPEETNLRDFSEAADLLEAIYNGYELTENYADLFNYETPNTIESLFEWQFDNSNTDANHVQFQLGSRAVQSMGTDACYFAGFDHAVPTEWAYSTVEEGGIWEKGDLRKNESIRYDFTWFGQKPDLKSIAWEDLGDDHDELKPHIKKYEDFRTDRNSGLGINNMWNSGKNIPFLRVGNAVLLYAECLNEIGRQDDALDAVNYVRERAFGWDMPDELYWESMSKDQFREQILTERVRELFGERWRKFDLIRTGKFVELVKARNKWAAASGTINENHKLWPIPQTEIDQNDEINMEDQNPGY